MGVVVRLMRESGGVEVCSMTKALSRFGGFFGFPSSRESTWGEADRKIRSWW